MGSALWAGISGLNASSKELDVIANNLANVNTVGYKAGTTFFADVLSSSISGGSSGSLQVGRGVAVADVQTQFSVGSFETTGNATDVAIDGDGFFMLNDANGATYYTRAGSFHENSDGFLVDTNGYSVQGQAVVNGARVGALTDINLTGVRSEPEVTTTFSLGANLNSATATGEQYNAMQTVYDSLGTQHSLNTTFTKTENITGGYWAVESSLDSIPTTAISANGYIFDSQGQMTDFYTGAATAGAGITTITANRPGMIYKDTTSAVSLSQVGGIWSFDVVGGVTQNGGYANATILDASATNPQISLGGTDTADLTIIPSATTVSFTLDNTTMAMANVTVDFSGITLDGGATIGAGGNLTWDLVGADALDITQYGAASVIRSLSSDGYAAGDLKTLSIDQDGRISGFFTNGQTADVAQLILALFTNPAGLKKMGSNLFGETVLSGSAKQNTPGESGVGSLNPNTLEMSNTDIATEFIKMITAQKAYQANAKVVTTEDSIMQVLMNLKQ